MEKLMGKNNLCSAIFKLSCYTRKRIKKIDITGPMAFPSPSANH